MRTKDVIGRKIVAVRQSRIMTNAGMRTVVDLLELDNGVKLVTFARECENHGPAGDLILHKKRRLRKS